MFRRKKKLKVICLGSIYKNKAYIKWEAMMNKYGFVLKGGE